MIIDIALILNRIKIHKSFKKDSDLHKFLEVSSQTLANWRKRKSMDWPLVLSKCEDIDLNWLIFGKETTQDVSKNIYKLENSKLNAEILELYRDKNRLLKEIEGLKKNQTAG